MGTNSVDCDNCTRRLAWSDPTRLDPETGAPTGVPEGEPEPCDMRQTLDLVGWTVANFRVSDPPLFDDSFESGDFTAWVGVGPVP